MSERPRENSCPDVIEQQAAQWVLRIDRGLTAVEQDQFSQWLAADPRHGAQLARHRRHWQRMDKLVQWCPEDSAQPNPDLLAPPLRRRIRRVLPVATVLAAAAAVMVEVALRPALEERAASHGPIEVAVAPAGHRLLEDGSNIELNRGTEVTVQFTAEERRIRLDEGEAHFEVTRDPARPFIVSARGLDVCAVGTAFNVRVDASVVEVLVTHGSVRVESPHSRSATPLVPVLLANQRAVLPLSGEEDPPRIATLTPGEVARVLSWQHRLLDFTATPLSEIVAEFNRRNVLQLVVIDPELAATRITASFRSDNIDGFIRLLEAGFNARAEHRGQSEILLHRN